jgi:MoCo/4Fe-4S cofactor protein with predicted Tat translocation signal
MSEVSNKQNKYWRSLNEVEHTPEFEQFLHREFPEAASEFPKGVSRRRWLQLMGASVALGAAGCRYEEEEIAPFAHRPQNRVPGESRKFSSVLELGGVGYPAMVTSYDGRPIKVDGNPSHPDSNGASTVYMQAAVLGLYDPDRSRGVKMLASNGMSESSWQDFGNAVQEWLADPDAQGGAGIAVLAQASSSPARIAQQSALLSQYPEIKWFEYEPLGSSVETGGTQLAFGQPLRQVLDLAKASVIVSLDADPMGEDAAALRNARGWAAGRDVDAGKVNRLYAVESQFTSTGLTADNRLPLKSGQMGGFVAALEAEVNRRMELPEGGEVDGSLTKREKFLAAMAQDLVANRGRSAVVAGARQPEVVQAIVHRLNVTLGNVSESGPVSYVSVAATSARSAGDISDLVQLMSEGGLRAILVLEGNPVYDAPADLGFAEAYAKVPNRVHLSLYEDETSLASTWHLNLAHGLETWGDARSFDGSWCVAQPLIDPIWAGKSVVELLGWLASGAEVFGRDLVRQAAVAASPQLSDDTAWKKVVHDGFLSGSKAAAVAVELRDVELVELGDAWKTATVESDVQDLELVLTSSGTVYDGRFANSSWLQECPDRITKVTWDNVALFAPSTAKALAVKQDTLVTLSLNGQELELPAFIQPGQAQGCIGVALGYGRTAAGVVGGSTALEVPTVGHDTYLFTKHGQGMVMSGLSVKPTDVSYPLSVTQDHHAIDKVGLEAIHQRVGDLVREGDWADYELMQHDEAAWLEKHDSSHGGSSAGEHGEEGHAAEDHAEDHGHEHKDEHGHEHHHWPYHHAHFENINLNNGPGYDGARWGMSIDLNKCIGCSTCVVACQSENNIPVVGKDQVGRGREMHWLRVDRYFKGDYDDPEVVTQPVACHHCENAPCEQVCPVAATVHSDEGLNDMVYNRCIGTRYCGNNCPYKVRRFNYLNYSEAVTFLKYPWADKMTRANRALQNLVMNPEVTVRSRGVMEKCTYCVQRIQNTKIEAKRENNRPIGPNEITTACQDACPTDAIVFGDLENKQSDVAKEHANVRAYAMLGELNVRPRTKYLARVRNPHPALVVAGAEH